jgi:hypothetical protein
MRSGYPGNAEHPDSNDCTTPLRAITSPLPLRPVIVTAILLRSDRSHFCRSLGCTYICTIYASKKGPGSEAGAQFAWQPHGLGVVGNAAAMLVTSIAESKRYRQSHLVDTRRKQRGSQQDLASRLPKTSSQGRVYCASQILRRGDVPHLTRQSKHIQSSSDRHCASN